MINIKHSILTQASRFYHSDLMANKPESNGKTIFVTGVNGHIGNHIVRDLLENGYRVKGSVRDLADSNKTKHVIKHAEDLDVVDRLELVEGDILDGDYWAELISGCDSLFHTATIYSNTKDGQLIIDTALLGTTHLLTAARDAGITRVVYTSSVAAVGNTPRGRPKTEDDWQTERSSPYIIAKTDSERKAWELAAEFDIDLRVINPSAVIGGGFVNTTPSVDFFPDIMNGNVPAAPKIPLSIVHVKDVAIAHRKAYEIDDAAGRFILAPHNNLTLADVCRAIKRLYPNSKAPKLSIPRPLMHLVILFDWFNGLRGKKRYMTRKTVKGFFRGDSNMSSQKATEVLGMDWISLDKCLTDTINEFKSRSLV